MYHLINEDGQGPVKKKTAFLLQKPDRFSCCSVELKGFQKLKLLLWSLMSINGYTQTQQLLQLVHYKDCHEIP